MVSTPNILFHVIDEIINVTKIWRRYKISGQIRVKPICAQISNKKTDINNNIKIR